MNVNAIIVDDEPLARRLVFNLLKRIENFNVLGQYGAGKDAVKAINSLGPDIVFLDIQLKDMTGFDVLEGINIKHRTIILKSLQGTPGTCLEILCTISLHVWIPIFLLESIDLV